MDNQIGVIRARIEAEVARPCVLAVTSAEQGDGKTMIAMGVAQSMAAAGHRVLVIDAASETTLSMRGVSEIEDILRAIKPGDGTEPDMLGLIGLAPKRGSFSIQALRAIFAWCREKYDYCFVDTRAAVGSPLAVSLSIAADAVIVAVRFGRAASGKDRELISALKATKANLLGIVTTNGSAISTFARLQSSRRNLSDKYIAKRVKSSIVTTESTVSH